MLPAAVKVMVPPDAAPVPLPSAISTPAWTERVGLEPPPRLMLSISTEALDVTVPAPLTLSAPVETSPLSLVSAMLRPTVRLLTCTLLPSRSTSRAAAPVPSAMVWLAMRRISSPAVRSETRVSSVAFESRGEVSGPMAGFCSSSQLG